MSNNTSQIIAPGEDFDKLKPKEKDPMAEAQRLAYLQQIDRELKKRNARLKKVLNKKQKSKARKKLVKRLKRGKHK